MFLPVARQQPASPWTKQDGRGVGLEAFVEAEDLAGGRRRHGRKEERVAQAGLDDLVLERVPLPQIGRGDLPEVELKQALGRRAAFKGRVGAVGDGELVRGLERGMVERLEDLLVEQLGLRRVERHAQDLERVGEALDADADGAVAHVGPASLLDGIVVDVDDAVQVASHLLGHVVQLLEVVRAVDDERGQGDRGQVADGDLVRRRVLDDLGAQVGRLDRAQVLLVRFRWKAKVSLGPTSRRAEVLPLAASL